MLIRQCQNHVEYEDLADMLHEYILELNQIDKGVKVRDIISLKNEYFYNEDTYFYIIYKNNVPVGFTIIGDNTNCHEDADIYIEEFYIRPLFRREHYGRSLILHVLFTHKPDTLCFRILKKNKQAHKFWSIIFSEWSKYNLIDTAPSDNTDFFSYERRTF